jgi:hypothetical protein
MSNEMRFGFHGRFLGKSRRKKKNGVPFQAMVLRRKRLENMKAPARRASQVARKDGRARATIKQIRKNQKARTDRQRSLRLNYACLSIGRQMERVGA